MSANVNLVGHIRTPYQNVKDCPHNIQFDGPLCEINLAPLYWDELKGLREGQNILVLYWLGNSAFGPFEKSKAAEINGLGTFALRTPYRPNPIGAAVLPIERLNPGQVLVRGLDCLDNTGLIDIKPAIHLEDA